MTENQSPEQRSAWVSGEPFMDIVETCRFFGGSKPIHAATLYRGVKSGRFPAPVKIGPNSNRWVRA
jgi:predicted DNA-binding transcriptional regulator AlpA